MRHPRRGMKLACAIAGTASALLAATPAAMAATASGAGPQPAEVAVPQGATAAALPAKVFGLTRSGTRETVSFVLKARNQAQLQAQVAAGMPHGYLSVARFAADYGQTRSHLLALEHYLARYGMKATVDADRLDVTVRGTAGEFDRALSVRQHNYLVQRTAAAEGQPARALAAAQAARTLQTGQAAQTVQIHGTTDRPLLPRTIASYVQSVVGLTDYSAFASNAVHRLALAHGVRPSGVQAGKLTPASFATRYDLRPLQAGGAKGQRQTIGVVTLASMRPSDAEYFWANVLKIRTRAGRIRLDNVDGGAGQVSDAAGSGETTLDVEQSGALAPQASIVVYQAPNTDAGFLDAYFAAASQNLASTVSSSWGQSESSIASTVAAGRESASYARSFDEAFLELAAQGQTSFSSVGDSGAYDAYGDIGSTNLSVDNPADSPWTTDAGGTTLPGSIPLSATASATIPAERAWGWDWMWPHYGLFTNPATGRPYATEGSFLLSNVAGGGGGFSKDELAPAYQRSIPGAATYSAVPYFTPSGYATSKGVTLPVSWTLWEPSVTSAPAVVTGVGSGREVPDLAADADPYTGYEEYFSGFSGARLQTGWGGTSFVAPQLAGAAAVIDSYLGRRSGFWNPAMYRLAGRPGSPFTPLDATGAANDNLFYSGTRGHIYNVGTGLGTPNLDKLAQAFRRSRG